MSPECLTAISLLLSSSALLYHLLGLHNIVMFTVYLKMYNISVSASATLQSIFMHSILKVRAFDVYDSEFKISQKFLLLFFFLLGAVVTKYIGQNAIIH